jgi:FkbM family methyltransferase
MAKLFIFVPAFGRQITTTTFETSHFLMGALMSKGISASIASFSWPDIEEIRNMVLSYWYDAMPDSTHLLFMDADTGFPAQAVIDMLTFNEPVVGGLYPKKTYPIEWVGSGLGAGEYRKGFIEVDGLGAGCLLIRRDAVTAMLAKFPELVRPYMTIPDMRYAGASRTFGFFDCLRVPEGKVSEDISFCRRYRETGGKIWASTAYEFTHEGPHAFTACFAKERTERAAAMKFVTVPTRYGEMMVNPNDTFIGRSLIEYGEWCQFEMDLLDEFVCPGDTVIDGGANIGTHAVAFASMVGDTGRVFAFEPQPRLYDMLAVNSSVAPGIITSSQRALGSKNGSIPMADLPPDHIEFNFGAVPLSAPGTGTASMWTIDALELKPSLIKIDVEGMEADVIRGAQETIRAHRPVLYLECNGDNTTEIADVLEEIGYRAYWSIGPYFNLKNFNGSKRNLWPNVVPSANLIAVPDDSPIMITLPRFMRGDNWRAVDGQAAA